LQEQEKKKDKRKIYMIKGISNTFECLVSEVIFMTTQEYIITLVTGFAVLLRRHNIAMSEYCIHLQRKRRKEKNAILGSAEGKKVQWIWAKLKNRNKATTPPTSRNKFSMEGTVEANNP
jgi:hypothetical protein